MGTVLKMESPELRKLKEQLDLVYDMQNSMLKRRDELDEKLAIGNCLIINLKRQIEHLRR